VIAFVSGRVAGVGPEGAVIDVGGVGLQLFCTPATVAGLRVGEATRLATALVVREDSLTLFGFADDDERAVFELLQTVNGVGPRLAQAVLAVHRPDALRRIVATDDVVGLTSVPGIGRKGAQRLVLELKDRLGLPEPVPAAGGPASAGSDDAWQAQVRDGLVGLGWAPRDADAAVRAVAEDPDTDPDADLASRLRTALRLLGPR
jgi:Holliday junction DNA helicase RuvA